ncbi:MAG: threonine--tRNA ligase [Oscillospiraceae bacterium]|jgi:threonyl-tRNA synthetase|nr:threonine--tRNA ligase [Oscillospiraceae bacterium]
MVKITLKDGSVLEAEGGITAYELAGQISAGLQRNACAAEIDGKTRDLRTSINGDCKLSILTFEDEGGKAVYWHTASHVLAQAVKRLFPDTKLAGGPAIANGFYYDFDGERPFTADDFAALEDEMKSIIKANLPLERFTLDRADAEKLMSERAEPYKLELIDEHGGAGEELCFYRQGEFVDLCAGPHLMHTGQIKAFRLLQCTGAYWRGDAKNRQLCRLYGTAFPKSTDLEAYLAAVEEAKSRDHNLLGRKLGYFTTSELIGQGLPILLPKGARVLQILQRFVEDEEQRRGWQLTKTPYMAKSDLYKISGHWDHYRDGMFVIGDPDSPDAMALRPMTCPFQYQAYLASSRSYRDLPLRYNETSTLFRNEDSGEMHGLIRVRQFTISEGHLMCRPDQLEDEFRGCLELAVTMLKTLGLYEDVTYRFSKWDPDDREKYIGAPEQWDEAQGAMEKILNHLEIPYTVGEGEAAFYGPKLDIQIKNVHGKEDTLITLQIDQMLAEKFGMEYVDSDGTKKNPVIIHRTSIGCYERTLALLLEKYAGDLPFWIAPEQARVLPISEKHFDYAKSVCDRLLTQGIRAEVDCRNEKIGYKIRQGQLDKIPYMLIVGEKETENGTVSVRSRKDGVLGEIAVADLAVTLK